MEFANSLRQKVKLLAATFPQQPHCRDCGPAAVGGMFLAAPSDWREWCTHPAILTSAAVGVSFFSMALLGQPDELEVFAAGAPRPHHGAARCNSLLQLAWNVVVHPEEVDLRRSSFLERFPSDGLTRRVLPLRERLVGGSNDGISGGGFEEDEEESSEATEDADVEFGEGTGREDAEVRSLRTVDDDAIHRRLRYLEERAVQLQHEAARHRSSAALAEVTMQRERELRVSAEEDARMYKESLEEQYLMRQQVRDSEARLRESAAREAALVREIQTLRQLLAQYEESSGDEDAPGHISGEEFLEGHEVEARRGYVY